MVTLAVAVGLGVTVADAVGVRVRDGVDVTVRVAVALGVRDGGLIGEGVNVAGKDLVAVALFARVDDGRAEITCVEVRAGCRVDVPAGTPGVCDGAIVGTWVAVNEGVKVGARLGVMEAVWVTLGVGVMLVVSVGLTVEVGSLVGVIVGVGVIVDGAPLKLKDAEEIHLLPIKICTS